MKSNSQKSDADFTKWVHKEHIKEQKDALKALQQLWPDEETVQNFHTWLRNTRAGQA